MKTPSRPSAIVLSLFQTLIALLTIALGATGIAALVSDTDLALSFVFGSHLWLVWLSTGILLLAIFGGLCARMYAPQRYLVQRHPRYRNY